VSGHPRSILRVADLPTIFRNALGVIEVVKTLGFPDDAVTFMTETAKDARLDVIGGTASTDGILSARVSHDDRTCSYVLGFVPPDYDAWLSHAKQLWRSSSDTDRMALYESSPIFIREHFENLVRGILSNAGLVPPIALGVVFGRLAKAEFAEIIRRQPMVAARTAPATRSVVKPVAPVTVIGPPRWRRGELVVGEDQWGVLDGVDVEHYVARHVAGDWGETSFHDENEHALRTGRTVTSVFRTDADNTVWVSTCASRSQTTVMPQKPTTIADDLYVDLICTYVATTRRSELPPESFGTFYIPAYLIGVRGAGNGDDEERAVLLLFAMIAQSDYGETLMRYEQALWALRRAVMNIDFRPMGKLGRRIAPLASRSEREAATEKCNKREYCAWFLCRFEQRLA
jgi:hypothetical protein